MDLQVKQMRKRFKARKIALHTIAHFFLIVLALLFLIPIFYMVVTSFMGEVESGQGIFFPTEWHFENYVTALDKKFLIFFKNSLIVVGCNVIFIPLAATFTAFAFVRCKFVGQNVLFAIILSTMMIPGIVCQIPMFVIYVRIGWYNTLTPLIVPAILGGGAGNIFLARQYMRSIPASLDEAATIDGASRFRVFFNIYLPLSVPILIFIMIGVFNGTWNDFMGPLMYLRKPETYTLALGVFMKYAGRLSEDSFPNVQMATGVLMIIPSAVIFFIFQKQLIDGVAIGGVKG